MLDRGEIGIGDLEKREEKNNVTLSCEKCCFSTKNRKGDFKIIIVAVFVDGGDVGVVAVLVAVDLLAFRL